MSDSPLEKYLRGLPSLEEMAAEIAARPPRTRAEPAPLSAEEPFAGLLAFYMLSSPSVVLGELDTDYNKYAYPMNETSVNSDALVELHAAGDDLLEDMKEWSRMMHGNFSNDDGEIDDLDARLLRLRTALDALK